MDSTKSYIHREYRSIMNETDPAPLDDDAFLAAFEGCQLAGSTFRHRDHVRLTWLYLRRFGYASTLLRVREGIRRFAIHHGATGKYHDTLTAVWVRLVAAAILETPDIDDFDTFVDAHEALLDRGLPLEYYSPELLWGNDARAHWVDPDVRPLPAVLRWRRPHLSRRIVRDALPLGK